MCQRGWSKNIQIMYKSHDHWFWFCNGSCCIHGQVGYYNVLKAVLIFNVVPKLQKFIHYFWKLFVLLFLYYLSGEKKYFQQGCFEIYRIGKMFYETWTEVVSKIEMRYYPNRTFVNIHGKGIQFQLVSKILAVLACPYKISAWNIHYSQLFNRISNI